MNNKTFIYLDHLAATPLAPEARSKMEPYLSTCYGNPSGLHSQALQAADAVLEARKIFAKMIQASSPEEILFTSGGTESANLAIKGLAFAQNPDTSPNKHLIASAIEHPSVLGSLSFLEKQGFSVTLVPVSKEGFIDPAEIRKALRPETFLIATHLSNFDLGTIQDVRAICEIAHQHDIPVFCDATTGGGWLPIHCRDLGADLISLAPHRFYGPKGVGILYKRTGLTLEPLHHGGRQEYESRAGTENVSAIVGAGAAAQLVLDKLAERASHTREMQELLHQTCLETIPRLILNGPPPGPQRDPHHLNFSIESIEGEALMLMLDVKRLAVASSTGCLTRAMKISHVARAIGLDEALALGTILLSPGESTTPAHVTEAVHRLQQAVEKLRSMSPSR